MKGLKIGDRSSSSFLPIDVYRVYLQQRRTFYWVHFNPYVVNETIKSKLLDFIKSEFAPFIREDRILSATGISQKHSKATIYQRSLNTRL